MNHGGLQNHGINGSILVAGAGVNPADQRWLWWPLLSLDFIKFTREGHYLLFVYQTGKKPNEQGGF